MHSSESPNSVSAFRYGTPTLHGLHPLSVGNTGWKGTLAAHKKQGLELWEKRKTPTKGMKRKKDSGSNSEEYAPGNC